MEIFDHATFIKNYLHICSPYDGVCKPETHDGCPLQPLWAQSYRLQPDLLQHGPFHRHRQTHSRFLASPGNYLHSHQQQTPHPTTYLHMPNIIDWPPSVEISNDNFVFDTDMSYFFQPGDQNYSGLLALQNTLLSINNQKLSGNFSILNKSSLRMQTSGMYNRF